MSRLPIIGVTDCSLQSGLHAHHISGDTSVRVMAIKARGLPMTFLSQIRQAASSNILDVRIDTLLTVTPFNIDRFHFNGARRVQAGAHDFARRHCAQEMQRQRKGQVSSSFSVYARCQANAGTARKHALQRDAHASNIA
ncbi:hypothetical protein GIW70_22690 [Pseudomonas syringae]|nr:hypothetical protein [Pseudomonas syringae]MCF5070989.1 hypothetical protein [Pseudomonas syringae]